MSADRDLHELDAAYVLGALGSEDRRAFEAHLADCQRCTASLGELAGLPGLLGLLEPDDAVATLGVADATASGDAALVTRLAAVETRRRWRDRIVAAVAVAASAAAIIVFGVVGVGPAPGPLAGAVTMEQIEPVVMTAQLLVTEKGWGTRLDWTCAYAAAGNQYDNGPLPTYVLVVIDVAGGEHTVASWQATGGDRAGGLSASSSVPFDAIRAVEIRYAGSSGALARTVL
jgi:hypothetical protein